MTAYAPAAAESQDILRRLGVPETAFADGGLATRSPVDGSTGAAVAQADPAGLDAVVARSVAAFHAWKRVPPPRRGELVRLLGEELRASKADLARLVTLEAGKIVSEGLGELQEMIDI